MTVSEDQIQVWNFSNEDCVIQKFTKYLSDVRLISFQFFTKKIFVSFNENEEVYIYDFNQFQQLITIKKNKNNPFQISNDSKLIAYDFLNQIIIQELGENSRKYYLETRNISLAIAFSNNCKLLANLDSQGYLKIWNLQQKQIVGQFKFEIMCQSGFQMFFSKNNQYIICNDRYCMILDIAKIESISLVEMAFENQGKKLTWFSKFNHLITYSELHKNAIVRKIKIEKKQFVFQNLHNKFEELSYSFQRYLAVKSAHFALTIIDLNQLNKQLHFQQVRAFYFTSNEKLFAIQDNTINLIDLEKNNIEVVNVIPKYFISSDNIIIVQYLFLSSTSIILQIINKQIETEIYILTLQQQQFHQYGKIKSELLELFLCNSQEYFCMRSEQQLKFLSIKNCEIYFELKDQMNQTSMDFNYDLQFVALSSIQGIKLWNFRQLTFEQTSQPFKCNDIIFIDNHQIVCCNGKILHSVSTEDFGKLTEIGSSSKINYSLSFSDKSNLLASNSEKQILLWDIKTKSKVATFSGHSGKIYSISFSKDGQMIASGGQDKQIRLWNAFVLQNETSKDYHTESISFLKFSPDGLILVSASLDGLIKCWSLRNKKCLGALINHTSRINNLEFSKNQRLLISCDNQNIILWKISNWSNIHSVFLVQNSPIKICQVLFSKNQQILSLHQDSNSITYLWSFKDINQRIQKIITIKDVNFYCYCCLHSSSLIAYMKKGKIKIIDLKLKEISEIESSRLTQFIFSDNGEYLAGIQQNIYINQNLVLIWYKSSLSNKWKKIQSISLIYQLDQQNEYLKFSQNNNYLIITSKTHISILKILQNSQSLNDKGLIFKKMFNNIHYFIIDQARDLVALAYDDQSHTPTHYISILRLNDFQQIKLFQGFDGKITLINFSFDDQYLSASLDNGKIYVWNYQIKSQICEPFQPQGKLQTHCFVKKFNHILISCYQKDEYIIFSQFHLQNQFEKIFNLKIKGQPIISPFGDILAIGTMGGLELLDLDFETQQGFQLVKRINLTLDNEFELKFNLNQTLLGLITNKKRLVIKDIKKEKIIYSFQNFIDEKAEIQQFNFSTDMETIFVIYQNIFYQLAIDQGNSQCPHNHFYKHKIKKIDCKDDFLLILSKNNQLKIIQKIKQNCLSRFYFEDQSEFIPIIVAYEQVLQKNKSDQLVIYNIKDNTKSVLNFTFDNICLSQDQQLLVFTKKGSFGFADFHGLQKQSENNQYAVFACQFSAHELNITSLMISGDKKLLSTKCKHFIKMWDISNLSSPQIKFQILGTSINEQFSFDSKFFSRICNNQLIILEIDKFPQDVVIQEKTYKDQIIGLRIHQTKNYDENLLLFFRWKLIQKDLQTDQLLNEPIKFETQVSIFEFSDVCQTFAYVFMDKTKQQNINLRKLVDQEAQVQIIEKAHQKKVKQLSYSRNGMLLLSGGSDYSIKIWCVKSLVLLAMISNFSAVITQVSFSFDSFHFAAGTNNKAVFLYATNIEKLKFNTKNKRYFECLGQQPQMSCLKEFSQAPLLQMENYSSKDLKINPENQSLKVLFDQKHKEFAKN